MDAAIVLLNDELAVHDTGKGEGFVWVELTEVCVYSCYCSRNVDLGIYERFIAALEADVRLRRKGVIVAGDFNAKAVEWGSPFEDRRGALLTEWINEARMVVLNQGNRPTFIRNDQKSYIDLTICTEGVTESIKN